MKRCHKRGIYFSWLSRICFWTGQLDPRRPNEVVKRIKFVNNFSPEMMRDRLGQLNSCLSI